MGRTSSNARSLAHAATEIKLRAERKAGELLAQLERDKPRPGTMSNDGHGSEYATTLEAGGIGRPKASRLLVASSWAGCRQVWTIHLKSRCLPSSLLGYSLSSRVGPSSAMRAVERRTGRIRPTGGRETPSPVC